MNNTLVQNSSIIVDNNIAIEIPSVTGHVQIIIPTVATVTNLLDLNTMSNTLRYSPGGYNIVGSNGTKYGLIILELEPNSTYYLKIQSGYTGGLFNVEPVKNSKTTSTYNLNGSGAGTHEIITTSDYYWLALNIATTDTSNESIQLTPTSAWQSALLYKNE